MKRAVWTLAVATGMALAAPDAPPLPEPDAIAQEIRRLGDTDYDRRRGSFEKLLAWGLSHPEEILQALPKESQDPEVRASCEELGRRILLDRRIREALRGVQDPPFEAEVRRFFESPTRVSMSEFARRSTAHKKEAAEILVEFLDRRHDKELREGALYALGQLGERSVVKRLLPLLDRERGEETSIRFATLHLLGGNLRDAACVPEILKLLSDREPKEIRSMAIWALGVLKDRSAVPELVKFLDWRELQLLHSALYALGQIGDPEAIPAVSRFLEETPPPEAGVPEEEVKGGGPCLAAIRTAAAGALVELKAPNLAPRFIAFLSDESPQMNSVALQALGKLKDRSTVKAISRFLTGGDQSCTFAALMALGEIGGPEAARAAARFLEGEEPFESIHIWAAQTLWKCVGNHWETPGDRKAALAWWREHKDDPEWAEKSAK